MGINEFFDFLSVSYTRISVFYILFFVLSILCYVSQILEGSYSAVVMYSGLVLFVFIMRYVFSGFSIRAKYQQSVSMTDIYLPIMRTYFSSVITVFDAGSSGKEYGYEDINAIYETKKFFLLGLKKNLFIIVNKGSIPQDEKDKFIKFIFSKCVKLKKKHIINITDKKKLCLTLTIITAAIFAMSIIFSVINTIYPIPSLF